MTRTRQARPWLTMIALTVVLAVAGPSVEAGKKDEPTKVLVQHILIAYKGKVPGKKITRTKKEAEALAEELFARAKEGEDFDALVEEYTDDRYPGIYALANIGEPRPVNGFTRDQMAIRFGDVAFSIAVDEVGLAAYSGSASPYGWHIIKRLE